VVAVRRHEGLPAEAERLVVVVHDRLDGAVVDRDDGPGRDPAGDGAVGPDVSLAVQGRTGRRELEAGWVCAGSMTSRTVARLRTRR
jgi:hypothetical protein